MGIDFAQAFFEDTGAGVVEIPPPDRPDEALLLSECGPPGWVQQEQSAYLANPEVHISMFAGTVNTVSMVDFKIEVTSRRLLSDVVGEVKQCVFGAGANGGYFIFADLGPSTVTVSEGDCLECNAVIGPMPPASVFATTSLGESAIAFVVDSTGERYLYTGRMIVDFVADGVPYSFEIGSLERPIRWLVDRQ